MARGAWGAASLLTVLLLAPGCGPTDDTVKEQPMDTPPPSASSGVDPSEQARAAVDDLAARLQTDPAAIEVVAEEPVTWRDGSLGCARPGMSYTQAMVEGLRITLRVDGADHEYHSSGDRQPFWCKDPTQ